jgi:malic enzyme
MSRPLFINYPHQIKNALMLPHILFSPLESEAQIVQDVHVYCTQGIAEIMIQICGANLL